MTDCPPKRVARRRVCTTLVSWYSSRSTVRYRSRCEPPGGCLAEHCGVGLAPDEHRVLAVDRAREGVVGTHRCRLERIERHVGDALGDELGDALTHAFGELAGRLAGEGQ